MNLETDLLLDRRRLKRRLFFWRGLAVLALLAAGLSAAHVGWPGEDSSGAYVARLSVNGIILDSRTLTERIVALAGRENARAVIVSIDSPGGTVGGGEGLYRALSLVAAKKPVVVVMRGTAASAGYMIAMPAARIFARDSTITGSIGVKLETAEMSGLMRTLGVSAETIASGPLKDQPSLTHPTSAEGRAVLQALITDMYEQFVEMVARGRHMEIATVRQLADGRAYTGRQALKLGLVDAIGGEAEARAWLADEKKISASLPVRDVATRSLSERLSDVGGESLFGGLWKTLFSQRVTLDGAWAVWQPGQN
jgi:protease IV